MKLIEHLWPELIIPELRGQSKPDVIAELACHLARKVACRGRPTR